MTEEHTQKSFLENLWERRFLQYFISYLAAVWAIVQVVDWAVKRYQFAPALTDAVILFLLTLLPSVLVFIYYHGRPGPDQWRTIEKIIIPLNLLLSFFLVGFIFKGQLSVKASEKVTVTDEEGNQTEREVPTNNFTSRVILFPYENKCTSEEDKYMSISIPMLQSVDFEQDNRLFTFNPSKLDRELEEVNYQLNKPLPVAVQRTLAQDELMEYFLSGSISKQDENYTIETNLYSTKTGKKHWSKTYTNSDYFEIVDQVTVEVSNQIFLADAETTEIPDLPAKDLFANSKEGMFWYSKGFWEMYYLDDYFGSIASLEKATEIDPGCGECHLLKGSIQFRVSQNEGAQRSIEAGMNTLDRLSERQKFLIKFFYYESKFDQKRVIKLLEMWKQLYPMDYRPYDYLMTYFSNNMDYNKSEAVGLEAIENGHSAEMYKNLADLSMSRGQYEKGEKYLKQFLEKYPEKEKETTQLGRIYEEKKEYEKAREHYERLILLDPTYYKNYLNYARLETRLGNFEASEKNLNSALEKAKITQDSINVFYLMANLARQRGQFHKSIELTEKRSALRKKIYPEFEVDREIQNFNYCNQYKMVGREAEILKKAKTYNEKFKDKAFPNFSCYLMIAVHMGLENGPELKKWMHDCANTEETYSDPQKLIGLGFMHFFEKEYDKAQEFFSKYKKTSNTKNSFIDYYLGQTHYHLKQYDEAEPYFESLCENVPSSGNYNLWLAKIQMAKGNKNEAMKSLDITLKSWKNGDKEFIYLKEAKKLKEEWASI